MNFLLSLWYRIVGEPSTSKAVKNMQRSIAKLNKATAWQANKAARLAEAAERAARASGWAKAEGERAGRVHAKLAELLEVE